MEGIKKAKIKKVLRKEDRISVKFEKEFEVSIKNIKMRYNLLILQIKKLEEEKSKIQEIMKKAKII